MIQVRKAGERGQADYGWLNTHHTFSFNTYHDPNHQQFRALRVMNEDRIAGGSGFGDHPHRDMEIVTYVLEGALQHRDSMGSGSVIRAGELQRMSAGTGVSHSEFNASPAEPAHFYQIWLFPREKGLEPGYEQKAFPVSERQDILRLVASPDGAEGSLTVNQDARMYLANLTGDGSLGHGLAADRHAWVQVVRGRIEVNGEALGAGDGAAVSGETKLRFQALDGDAELMLFDLP